MEHLKTLGTVVYLRLPYPKLRRRLHNLKGRGVVLKEGQSFRELFQERSRLYEKYADVIIEEENRDIEATLKEILNFYLQNH